MALMRANSVGVWLIFAEDRAALNGIRPSASFPTFTLPAD
jgi:hypothetical protein